MKLTSSWLKFDIDMSYDFLSSFEIQQSHVMGNRAFGEYMDSQGLVQHAHPRSLIRAYTDRLQNHWNCWKNIYTNTTLIGKCSFIGWSSSLLDQGLLNKGFEIFEVVCVWVGGGGGWGGCRFDQITILALWIQTDRPEQTVKTRIRPLKTNSVDPTLWVANSIDPD